MTNRPTRPTEQIQYINARNVLAPVRRLDLWIMGSMDGIRSKAWTGIDKQHTRDLQINEYGDGRRRKITSALIQSPTHGENKRSGSHRTSYEQ